jgi:outer membrane protein insertion porin family
LSSTSSLPAQFGRGGPGGGSGGPPGPNNDAPKYRSPIIETKSAEEPVVAVLITGNQAVATDKIRKKLQTRVGRGYDAETIQADVRGLSTTGWFHNVKTYKKQVNGGIEVTFEVFELPIIRYVRYIGNKKIRDKKLDKKAELKVGDALHRYRVEEARRRLEEFYLDKGFSDAEVVVKEGTGESDRGVVFAIHEGNLQRIWKAKFVGNQVVTDARLRTQIKSKPGVLYYFKGAVDLEEVDADVDRLTSYYRGLGYFNARISRTLEFGESGKWLTVTFVVNEGRRYKIRNVSVIGNNAFTTESLQARLALKDGEYFHAKTMNVDLASLRDAYGGQGYIHADIKAEPRFLETPGELDLVYDIVEGEQYRVGRVIVNIEGENPHTRKNVILNRLSLSPGDIIDANEIRNSERRLRSSQLFLADPARGVVPQIAIKPPEFSSEGRLADRPQRTDPQRSAAPRGTGSRF